MRIVSNEIKSFVSLWTLCFVLNMNRVGSTGGCVQSVKDLFKNCKKCTTIMGQISYIMKHVLPNNLDSEDAKDYVDHLYFAIQTIKMVEGKYTITPLQFCMQEYGQKKTEKTVDTISEEDNSDDNYSDEEIQSSSCIALAQKKKKVWRNDYALEPVNSLDEQDELDKVEDLEKIKKIELTIAEEESNQKNAEKESEEKNADNESEEMNADNESEEMNADKESEVMITEEESNEDDVENESEKKGNMDLKTFFGKLDLLFSTPQNSVYYVYFSSALFLWSCGDNSKDEKKEHNCDADFMKKYIKKLVKNVDINVDNLNNINTPETFCFHRKCNDTIEETLHCFGNCHSVTNYISNVVLFIDYRELQDNIVKMYIRKLFDVMRVVPDKVSSPEKFCHRISEIEPNGKADACMVYLSNVDLHMDSARKNLLRLFYCRTVENVYDPDVTNFENNGVAKVGSHRQTTSRYFNPVSYQWQKQKSMELGLKVEKINLFYTVKKKLNKPIEGKLKNVTGDGNCYFRALSVWITGTESSYSVLRQMLVKFMKDCTVLINFYGGRKEVLKYLKSSKMENEGTWATDIEVMASAIMLNTTILVYAQGQTNNWERHHKSGDLDTEPDPNEKCIYLQTTNMTHFFVVAAVNEYPNSINYFELYIIHFASEIMLKRDVRKRVNSRIYPQRPNKFCALRTLFNNNGITAETDSN